MNSGTTVPGTSTVFQATSAALIREAYIPKTVNSAVVLSVAGPVRKVTFVVSDQEVNGPNEANSGTMVRRIMVRKARGPAQAKWSLRRASRVKRLF